MIKRLNHRRVDTRLAVAFFLGAVILFGGSIKYVQAATGTSTHIVSETNAPSVDAPFLPGTSQPDPCSLEIVECAGEERTEWKTVTAYNSVPEQTDDTPCIGSWESQKHGDDLCKLEAKGDHSFAAAYPYGTVLYVPGFGKGTVRDVLAKKYADRVDIYMGGREHIPEAKAWGIKRLKVTVVSSK